MRTDETVRCSRTPLLVSVVRRGMGSLVPAMLGGPLPARESVTTGSPATVHHTGAACTDRPTSPLPGVLRAPNGPGGGGGDDDDDGKPGRFARVASSKEIR